MGRMGEVYIYVACILIFLFASTEGVNVKILKEDKDAACKADLEDCRTERGKDWNTASMLKNVTQAVQARQQKTKRYLNQVLEGRSLEYNNKTGVYESISCEGKASKISCPTGTTIKVNGANYGRTEDEVCPNYQILVTDCTAKNSTKIVSKSCDAKESCQVRASHYIFGDPCLYTYKYLRVNYKCVETHETQE